MIRLFSYLVFFSAVAGGAWYLWDNFPVIQEFVEEKVHSSQFRTLEARYTAQDIMQRHSSSLLRGSDYTFLEPKLIYYPYLMMHTKYTRDRVLTEEGVLLWGLNDGEMVLNTSTWERSHGFEDCLISRANRKDFNVLKAILSEGGIAIDRELIYKKFKVDSEAVDSWINSAKDKKLILISGNKLRIHLQHPRLESVPRTKLDEPLVTQPTHSFTKMKKRYSPNQIQKLAEMAFGNNFAVRHVQQVFLPVHCISVQNPDGSIRTTYWNALNGHPFK
jgi:hypothetical protein